MVQGTNENAARRIAKNGFGTVASLDKGWFGQGIYFTSQVPYACNYSKQSEHGNVFLVSLVIPGNPCPITDAPLLKDKSQSPNPSGFLGKSCRPGYQSHYLVVNNGYPSREAVRSDSADELVVFEPSHALPLFLIYSSQLSDQEGSDNFQSSRKKESKQTT